MSKIKIEKFISLCGVCSRRDAGKLIVQKKVKIGNQILTNVAERVNIDSTVYVDGVLVQPIKTFNVWKYYKPTGVICTKKDPLNRVTIFDKISKYLTQFEKTHIISVGRLDINSEGLILLTNYGEFARKMELPINNVERVYKIRTFGNLRKFFATNKFIIQEYFGYKISSIDLLSKHNLSKNNWFQIILHEGKNREVRNIFKFLGLEVNRLIRVQYGKFKLNSMKPGDFTLTQSEQLI